MQQYILKNKELVPILIVGFLVVLILQENLLMLITGLIFVLLFLLYQKRFFILFCFATLIFLSTSFSPDLRIWVQVINICFLSYYFLIKYGIEFSKFPKLPFAIKWFIILLLITMIISASFSTYIELTLPQVIRTGLFFGMLYLIYSLLSEIADIKYFIAALLLSGAFLLFLTLYTFYLVDFDLLNFNQKLLLKGEESLMHKNTAGAFFVICISILTSFFLNNYNRKLNIVYAVSITLLLFGLIISNSRGAILALLISSLYLFYISNKKLLRRFVLTLIVIFVVIILTPISELFELYFKFDRISTGRDYILQSSLTVISNNPFVGAGPAASKFEIYKNLPYLLGSPEEAFLSKHVNQLTFGHAHNFYLFYFSDLGLPGFILSILLPIIFIIVSKKSLKLIHSSENYLFSLVLGIQAAGIALFVRGLFEWSGLLSYGYVTYDLPFWWIFSILVFIYQKRIVSSITNN